MALETGTYISDLVITNPTGTDDRSTADDHIRLLKDTIKTTFPNITGAMTVTHTQLNTLQSTFGGKTLTSTDDKIDAHPAGTTQLFQQTAAPTGWTKLVVDNNKALRLTTGTVTTGGTQAFTTTFGSGKTTDGHQLTVAEMPSHTHTTDGSVGGIGGISGVNEGARVTENDYTTSSTGGDGSHSHNLSNFDLQYVDVILASKD